jgi:hypothetical protein
MPLISVKTLRMIVKNVGVMEQSKITIMTISQQIAMGVLHQASVTNPNQTLPTVI